jgi:hypothetical protein
MILIVGENAFLLHHPLPKAPKNGITASHPYLPSAPVQFELLDGGTTKYPPSPANGRITITAAQLNVLKIDFLDLQPAAHD